MQKSLNIEQSKIGLAAFYLTLVIIIVNLFSHLLWAIFSIRLYSDDGFFVKLLMLCALGVIILSYSLMWQSSIPKKEGIRAKLAACSEGTMVLILGVVFSIIIVWLFNLENNYWYVLLLLIVIGAGIGNNKRPTINERVYERTWIDAAVITFGQILFIFVFSLIILFVSKKLSELNKKLKS